MLLMILLMRGNSMRNVNIQYYVEGDDEQRLVNVLKSELRVIRSGKVQKFNVTQQLISNAQLRVLSNGTIVVLIFDTDTSGKDILDKNIEKLNHAPNVSKLITIPQVPNLEGELVRSCNIKDITELLNSRSRSDFKRDFRRVTNLAAKLQEHEFDISRFWNQKPNSLYSHISNNAEMIKILKK